MTSHADPCLPTQSPPPGIGTIQTSPQCGQETIGVSDGTIAFDEGLNNKDLKPVAAHYQRLKNFGLASQLWQSAISAAPNDAEALIYQEDLNVINLRKSYVTFVVATILTPVGGNFIGGGRDILQGAYVAQKENNYQCSNLGSNCPLVRLLIANSGSNSSYATFVAKQIVNMAKKDPTFLGVMGWLNSTPTLKTIDILEKAHIPMISPTASSDQLTSRSPYFFRLAPPDSNQGKAGAQYAKEQLHAKNVAIFSDPNDAYSESLAAAFQLNFIGSGHNIVAREVYMVGSPNNLLDKLSDAQSQHPDLIYFAGYAKDISTLLASLNSTSHGSSKTVNVMGGDALYIPGDYIPTAQGKTNLHNLYFTAFAHPDELKNQQQLSFLSDYRNDFDPNRKSDPRTYGYNLPTGDIILTYDTIKTLIAGYKNARALKKGDHVTPDELRQGLSEINTSNSLCGISGSIAFKNGDPVNKTILVLNGDTIDKEKILSYSSSQATCQPT